MAAGGRKALRGFGVLLALGLSVAAVLLVVFGNDAKTIRVGVLLGAWGLMFGGLSLYPRRNVALASAANSDLAPATSGALELRDDAAARREFERMLEGLLHRELERGLRSELDSLRNEVAGLRGEVSQAMRHQVSLERVETRIVGADLAELQDEVRRRGPAVEPAPALAGNPEITEVMAAVQENASPSPALPSFTPPAPAAVTSESSAPRPASAPSVTGPSIVFNPPPPPVAPPVTPAAAPLGARRIPPVGPPRPSAPPAGAARPAAAVARESGPQFAVPGPPVWTGPSAAPLSVPAGSTDPDVPRPPPAPSFGNGTSLPPRSALAAPPQEMRWPWQEESRRATEAVPTPLAPKLTPASAAPPPVPPAEEARPATMRSDPFAGLPRLTPVSELDLPELLPDLPPPRPPAPARPSANPPSPVPSLTGPADRQPDAPDPPPRADAYVGRRRAAH